MRCFGGACSAEAQEIPCHTAFVATATVMHVRCRSWPGWGLAREGREGSRPEKAQAVLLFVLRSGNRAADASDCMDLPPAPGDLPR